MSPPAPTTTAARDAMLHLTTLGTINLTDADGQPCTGLLAQRKRLAVLLYLTLTAPDGPTRRDTLLPIFWPESDDMQARHALRQILHYLRRSLAPRELVQAIGDGLRVDLASVECDAIAFERALDERRPADALGHYNGDLLPGFHVTDAPQFEEWLEGERMRLRRRAADAAWAMARTYAADGNAAATEQMARRAAAITPGDEGAARQLIALLGEVGQFAEAERAYDVFADAHLAEYGEPPSAETRALIAGLRARRSAVAASDRLALGATIAGPAGAPVARGGSAFPSPAAASPTAPPTPSAVAAGRVGGRRRVRSRWAVALGSACFASVITLALAGAVDRKSTRDAPRAAASATAHQLYDVGLHLASEGDDRNAARFFLASLVEDTTSALAAYHAALSESSLDQWSAQRDLTRAWRLASHASAHDALTIRQSFAHVTNDRRELALADSLVTEFPGEAEGELALGMALHWSGDFLGAVPHLRRAITIDSAARANPDAPGSPRWGCQAYRTLVQLYQGTDSLAAADRVAHEWVARYPTERMAWYALASLAEDRGDADSSLVYGRRGYAISPIEDEALRRARLAIRAARFDVADRILTTEAADGGPGERQNAFWWLIVSLRAQGRLRDAMDVAVRWADVDPAVSEADRSNRGQATLLPQAEIRYEEGRFADAAVAWDSILRTGRPEPRTPIFDAPSLVGRHRTWVAAHLATALAAAGDTARLAAVADSIRAWGSIEAFWRDQRLHYYATGLLLAARGDTAAAIASIRQSVLSPTQGFSRAQYAAGRLLLAAHRPLEAIAMVQPVLRGALDGSHFYVTSTELHELLARAFVATGARDSAAVHYAYVARAWRQADPAFRARARTAAAFVP